MNFEMINIKKHPDAVEKEDFVYNVTFKTWLKQFIDVNYNVGEFTRAVMELKDFPDSSDFDVIKEYIDTHEVTEDFYSMCFRLLFFYQASYHPEVMMKLVIHFTS